MASVFMAALFALSVPEAAPAAAGPAAQDLRCYRLMATLAQDEDPRISSAGLTGAQYFLGRIDARAPGFDPEVAEAPPLAADSAQLLGQCSVLMGAGGRDFRAIGARLTPAPDRI